MKQAVISLALILSASVVYGSFSNSESEPFSFPKKRKHEAFQQGQLTAHIGMGFLVKSNYKDANYEFYGSTEYKKKLPFNMMFDYGVASVLSLGLYIGFYGEDVTITDNTNPNNIYGFQHKFKVFALRTTYHQPLEGKLDPFATLNIGFNACKAKDLDLAGGYNYLEPYKSGFAWSIHAGANYYFTDNIGAYLEAGYGTWIPIINLGVTVKI